MNCLFGCLDLLFSDNLYCLVHLYAVTAIVVDIALNLNSYWVKSGVRIQSHRERNFSGGP